ncbi:4-alpha-glucanotransferase [uncultured Jatrophihabitans sp.]|uniref:4-alpha-glucanotransferase n=1 Tax=uncultured Jatrophihabitans sp. TaxID=1610747 RepID=UPI0035CB81F1
MYGIGLDRPVTDDHGSYGEALRALATAHGIDTEYRDWQGQHRTVPEPTLVAVLAAMDVDASTAERCAAALEAHRDGDAEALPACLVVPGGTETRVPVRGTVELEDGATRVVDGVLPADLPLGYHRLVPDNGAPVPLIVTPARLDLPSALVERPGWGLAAQLYSVRSRASWGVGDLADLRTLAEWAAREHRADYVLINPVHAGEVVPPLDPSPYLPSSRRFADPLYLHVEDVPEYAALVPEDRAEVDRLGAAVRERHDDLVARDPAWTAKLGALRILLDASADPERVRAYATFRHEQGDALELFATWSALCEEHGNDWRAWPEAFRDPHGTAVADFAAAHAERVEFFARVQWLLDEQLTAVHAATLEAGMALGVVHDVAVGVSPSGADAWAYQDAMATTVTVGAPPDAYSQLGQDWGQPPWRPDRLAATGYGPIRELFASALRHGGGLRVDHIVGLFRLWWIPAGRPANEGTYVHYDHEALVGILALEAHRAGAVVIGEDLGNVEDSARSYLRERGLLGTSILWFETDPQRPGAPLPPQRWRALCLASVTTHDLPPTAGYLAGEHIRLRDELGLLTRPVEDELADAARDRQAWVEELVREAVLPASAVEAPSTEDLVLALHRFLTLTPSRLRCVALTDAVGDRRTQNQPGTSQEQYPNWRVPLSGPDGRPVLLEDVLTDERAATLLQVFAVAPD